MWFSLSAPNSGDGFEFGEPYIFFFDRDLKTSPLFFTWYMIVVLACLTATVIIARIPPLSSIKDYYCEGSVPFVPPQSTDESILRQAYAAGIDRAARADTPINIAWEAWYTAVGLSANVVGASMAIATTSLILVHHTDIFAWLSYPLYLVVELSGLPDARVAATGFLVGFFDMFAPALLAVKLESEISRFVIAGVAVSQIIYMSDLGVLLLRSGLPLNLARLFVIFLLRTAIVFPIFLISARLIF